MIYTYKCADCYLEADQVSTVAERKTPKACPECGGQAEFTFTANRADTHPRELLEQGVIHSEKQLAPRWRDQGTSGKPGGAGRVQTYDQKR